MHALKQTKTVTISLPKIELNVETKRFGYKQLEYNNIYEGIR